MILQTLSAVALRELINAGGKLVGMRDPGEIVNVVSTFLAQRFTDHGQKLTSALSASNARAWNSLEIALAGEGLFGWLDKAEDRSFRQQVRAYLDSLPAGQMPAEMRKAALRELRQARKDGLLTAKELKFNDLARQAAAFVRYSDPQQVLGAEWATIDRIADMATELGHRNLGQYLKLRPPSSPAPLLGIAVRYFFRRAVESDQQLYQGLTFTRLEGMAQVQEVGFAGLHDALARHGQALDQALGVLIELRDEIKDLRQEVQKLDIRAEQERMSEQMAGFHREVMQALEQNRLAQRELRPRDSLSIHNDAERRLVKQLVAKYRALPPGQQEQMPALLNGLAKLEVATGDYEGAQADFEKLRGMVGGDPRAAAEVHHNAYRTALERGDRALALRELLQAIRLDPVRFTPFPLDRYEPEQILGAGGFGVAFLCRHRFMNARAVVKALVRDDLGQDVQQVFAEAQHLRRINHPSIIGIQDCGYADTTNQARPYLVMDYFEGMTLEDHVKRFGPIPRGELPSLAKAIAEGLLAAHREGILHRDVKPGNVLVRKAASAPRAEWHVKIIDFGLAVSHAAVSSTIRQADSAARTVLGASIAGTMDYAAPEQMGKLPGVTVSYPADVYGFGRTIAFALLQSPNPSYGDWKRLDAPLADLLGACLEERPEKRPANFQAVLPRLQKLSLPMAQLAEEVLEVIPVRAEERKGLPRVEPVDELEVLPDIEPIKPKRRSGGGREAEPRVKRGHADVEIKYAGHTVRVECSGWTNHALVHHDGILVASGWPVIEGTYTFGVAEDGQSVQYEVIVRGPGMSFKLMPYFTIRRNGQVLFNDR